MHADHLFQTLDLDVALGEVGDAADQATLVEHDVEVVAVAFVVERVVDNGLEHALFLELGLLGRAFLQHSLHFEEVEAVEHDCAGHFGLRELRGFGVGFGLFAVLSVECAYETFADFLADFARVEAFHAQRTAVHQSAVTSAEFTVRASGPNGWVGCFEIFVNNQAPVLDQTTFVNEVEITIFNIFGTAAYAQTTLFDINCPLWTFFFLLLQLLHLFSLLIILGISFFIILFLKHDSTNLFIHQFVIWFILQRITLFELNPQPLALLQNVSVEMGIITKLVRLH